MSHARSQHPNAVLTPTGRRRMVACVLDYDWTIEATAERFQVDAKTVRKWRDRVLAEGEELCPGEGLPARDGRLKPILHHGMLIGPEDDLAKGLPGQEGAHRRVFDGRAGRQPDVLPLEE